MIKLTAAMVGHIYRLDAVVAGHDRILGGRMPLRINGSLQLFLKRLILIPGEPRLKHHRIRIRGRSHDGALGDIAFAATVERGIEREGEGVIAGLSRALHDGFDPGVIVANVKLIEFLRG